MGELSRHSAAPQAAGFFFQLDRALFRLSELPEALCIGIETLDDVAVQLKDDQLICEQDKSTTSPSAFPFADRSRGLWNSLCTWADALAVGELKPGQVEFHLVTNAKQRGGVVAAFGTIHDDDAAKELLQRLRDLAETLPSSTRTIARRLLRHETSLLLTLLKSVRCFSRDDDNSGELRRQIAVRLRVSGVDSDAVIDALLGWLHSRFLQSVHERVPAWITIEAFNAQLRAVTQMLRERKFRELPAARLVISEEDLAAGRKRAFVRQLALIEADEELVEEAIANFIRFGLEKLRLSNEGEIPDEEWEAFDQRLVEFWKPIHRMHRNRVAPDSEVQAGMATYIEAQTHREILSGIQTSEYYFTRGALERLSDILKVGWHPAFRERLK